MSSKAPSTFATLFWSAVVHLVFAMVALMGAGAVLGAVDILNSGEQSIGVAVLLIVLGLAMLSIGLGFFYWFYIWDPAAESRRQLMLLRYPYQPWMLRADWAARRMTDRASLAVSVFMWIWCAGWWGAIAFIWSVNRDKIIAAAQQSYGEAALGLIFPICGLIGLLVAVRVTLHWWRYGYSTLAIDTLPGYLGDSFRGTVSARLAKRPHSPIEATLVCEDVRWLKRRGANGRTTSERTAETLWEKSFEIAGDRLLWTASQVSIPIDVPLPAGQPACRVDEGGDGIVWKLAVRTTDKAEDGNAYESQFEIPVFERG